MLNQSHSYVNTYPKVKQKLLLIELLTVTQNMVVSL